MSLRFLQFSDFHLDSVLTGSRLAIPPRKRDTIRRDMMNGLHRALGLARQNGVDCVLVPGDLWDHESVSFSTATTLFEAFAALAPVPVIIAPGNHDAYDAFSYYHQSFYREKVGKPHPANVHIFTSREITPLQLPELPGVTFYGSCYTENVPRSIRTLAGAHPGDSPGLHVLLLHGSQDDALSGYSGNKMMAAPFSTEEILRAGFDYTALGHYHRYSSIKDHLGNIRAAYGGIPVARGLDECGTHCVLIGEIEQGGIDPEFITTEFVDPRQILTVEVPIDSSVQNEKAAEIRIEKALHDAGVRMNDIVLVRLTGRTHPEIDRFEFDADWRDQLCFHLVIDQDELEPEYDLDSGDATADKRVESRFSSQMKTLEAQATRDGDENRKRLVRLAHCLGLEALHKGEVNPRRVD